MYFGSARLEFDHQEKNCFSNSLVQLLSALLIRFNEMKIIPKTILKWTWLANTKRMKLGDGFSSNRNCLFRWQFFTFNLVANIAIQALIEIVDSNKMKLGQYAFVHRLPSLRLRTCVAIFNWKLNLHKHNVCVQKKVFYA